MQCSCVPFSIRETLPPSGETNPVCITMGLVLGDTLGNVGLYSHKHPIFKLESRIRREFPNFLAKKPVKTRMAAISLHSVAEDLAEYNYCEAMCGYSLCAFEVFPNQFNIHVADKDDKVVAHGTFEGPMDSMVVTLLASFYNVACADYAKDFKRVDGKPEFAVWLLGNIVTKVAKGLPKQYLMSPDKVWRMYADECGPRKRWSEKIRDGEVVPCDGKFEEVSNPVIGRYYHLSWANGGAHWILKSIDGENCTLITPKSKKERVAKVKDLRNTRKNQSGG